MSYYPDPVLENSLLFFLFISDMKEKSPIITIIKRAKIVENFPIILRISSALKRKNVKKNDNTTTRKITKIKIDLIIFFGFFEIISLIGDLLFLFLINYFNIFFIISNKPSLS